MEKKIKAYEITIDDYLAIIEMAKKNGIKPGQSMQKEFEEYFKNKKLKHKGIYPDKDMLLANLREEGNFKILDLSKKDKKDEK